MRSIKNKVRPHSETMDWLSPPTDFQFILFERRNRAENVARFYYLGWQPSLIDAGAVVRLYGRKGGHQRLLNPQPFTSLEEAWPLIRATIKTRLRHGYHVVQPERYCGDQLMKSASNF